MESHKTPFTDHVTRRKPFRQTRRAPDGGWGWFVLLAAHSTLVFREGIAKCLGVFLPTFKEYFDCTTSLIGWISSLCVTFADFTGTWKIGHGEKVSSGEVELVVPRSYSPACV